MTNVRDEYIRVYDAAARRFFDENSAVLADLRSIEAQETAAIRGLAEDLGVSLTEP